MIKATVIVALALYILASSLGCAINPVTPDANGEIRMELIQVEVIFDIFDQQIRIQNYNWNSARVLIEKLVGGTGEYPWVDVVNVRLNGRGYYYGNSYFETYARLNSGDNISINVTVEDLSDKYIFTIE